MPQKPQNLYAVTRHGRAPPHIYAATGEQAKRIFCREHSIRPGDYYCGISSLSARRLKPAEREAWEADDEVRRMTYVFLKGMMDIHVAVQKDSIIL